MLTARTLELLGNTLHQSLDSLNYFITNNKTMTAVGDTTFLDFPAQICQDLN